MRHKAVIDLLSDESLKELADKIAESHSEDLIQEVALVLLEMDDEKWEEINEGGYLRWYVIRTMLNMATSSRSNFAKKYQLRQRRAELREVEDTEGYDWETENDMRIVERILETYHWYDRDLLKLYLKQGSYRKTAAVTGIPFKSIGNTVKKTIEQLRLDYYAHITKRLLSRNSGIDINRSAHDRLEGQGDPEATRDDGTEAS
jgi:DNA-directed RNA polymerase specialized sigma24 family protein